MSEPCHCQAFKAYLENLSPDTVGGILSLAAPDIRFRDPIHDITGVNRLKRIYESLFETVLDPRYTVTHLACDQDLCFLRWRFACQPRLFGAGHPWTLEAVTTLRYDRAGLIREQVDHWDAGQSIYERVRGVGPVLRYFRKRRMRA